MNYVVSFSAYNILSGGLSEDSKSLHSASSNENEYGKGYRI
jgi:hypothetical protein